MSLDPDDVRRRVAQWLWVPDEARTVDTDDFLLIAYPDWFSDPTIATRWAGDRPAGEVVDDPGRRLAAARDAYLDAGRELAAGYHPGVKIGRHQRLAMVDDLWAMALARLRGRGPVERASCCYLYAVPGTHECAGCPRLRRR